MEVDNHVTEILEQAVEGADIIFETDDAEEEIEEIVEIIEEIEEIEEVEEVEEVEEDENNQVEYVEEAEILNHNNLHSNSSAQNEGNQNVNKQSKLQNNVAKHGNQVVHYDAMQDWGEEFEQDDSHTTEVETSNNHEEYNIVYENQEHQVTNNRDHENVIENENYEHNEITIIGDNDRPEGIVQNDENNIVYTVLNSKKDMQSHPHDSSDLEFISMKGQVDNGVQSDGTIYYQSTDGENIYVQAVRENDQQQYEYDSIDKVQQNNQEWNEEQNMETEQENQVEQEQIFLHEDEEGNLYYKNDKGNLQPVYLNSDGNYIITGENSNDDEDSQESMDQIQQEQQEHQQQLQHMEENYVLPDFDNQNEDSMNASNQGNDDSTVTISLIISEDENGQKRTQVIIPSEANEFKCNLCNKSFKTDFQLLKHNRLKHAREEDITTRNFPCDLCPKRFPDQNSLASHRRIHTGDRPFNCLECHKSFPTANNLRKHLTLHNPNPLQLTCIYCGRRFQDSSSLMAHEQSHLAGEMKTFSCEICRKCFTNSTDLNIHKKNHETDRKYDCTVCGREFNRLNNLQRHMMVHEQAKQTASEEILSCHVCGITYKFSSSLTRHMVTTHMNPEKLRQQAEEQRRKRETNYRRYLENRKTYETQLPKRGYRRNSRMMDEEDEDVY